MAVFPGKTFAEQGIKFPEQGQLLLRIQFIAAKPNCFPVLFKPEVEFKKEPQQASVTGFAPFYVELKTVELVPAAWPGMIYRDGKFQIGDQLCPDAGGGFLFAMDNASDVEIAPANSSLFKKVEGSIAGNVLYCGLLNRNLLNFNFQVPVDAMLTPYFRVKLATPGRQRVSDLGSTTWLRPNVGIQFDRDDIINCNFSSDDKFPDSDFTDGEWVWLKGKPLPVGQGTHVFRLRGGFDYCYLDSVALVPQGVAPDEKAPQAIKRKILTGEIVFQNIDLEVFVPERIAVSTNKPEAVEYFAAFNGSKEFRPFPCSIPANAKKICLKARINSPDAMLSGFKLSGKSVPQSAIKISNLEQEVFVKIRDGSVIGWKTSNAGWIIPFGDGVSLLRFQNRTRARGFMEKDISRSFVSGNAARNANGESVELIYAPVDGIAANINITMPGQGLAGWKFTINNQSSSDISAPEFPRFINLRIGMEPEKNYAVAPFPNHGGVDFPGALLGILQTSAEFNGSVSKTDGIYPGHYALGYLCVYTRNKGSFTAQVRDTDGMATKIYLQKGVSGLFGDAGFERRQLIPSGQSGSGSFAAGYIPNDWHQAADIYRDWALTWMNFSLVNANWTKMAHGWVSGWPFVSAFVATRFATHLAPEVKWLGANYMQHFASAFEPECSASTFPAINPNYGTAEEFRQAHDYSRRHGVFNTYYWNSRGWAYYNNTDRIAFEPKSRLPKEIRVPDDRIIEKGALRSPAGAILPYGYFDNAASMDPASRAWQDMLQEGFVKNYCTVYGTDGVYWDEGCTYIDCFDETHQHGKQYGLYSRGEQDAFRQALTKARKFNKDACIATEGNPDQIMQYADWGLWGMTAYNDGALFLYTFPEAKLLRGHCNPGGNWFMSNEEYIRFINLFLRLDFVYPANNSRKFFQHRARIAEWMYNAVFKDDIGLVVSRPLVNAKNFLRNEPGCLGAVINFQNENEITDAEATLEGLPFKDAKAYVFTFEEETARAVEVKHEGDKFMLKVPPEKASSILLIGTAPPHSLSGTLVWNRQFPVDGLDFYIINLDSVPRSYKLQLQEANGLKIAGLPPEVNLQAGELKKLSAEVQGISDLPDMLPVTLRVSGDKTEQDFVCYVSPPLANAGFEKDSAGKGTPDRWRTFNHAWYTQLVTNQALPFNLKEADGALTAEYAASGKHSLKLNGSVVLPDYWGAYLRKRANAPQTPYFFNTAQRLILKPGCRYRASVQYRPAAAGGSLQIQSACYNINPRVFAVQTAPYTADKVGKWNACRFEFSVPDDVPEADFILINNSVNAVYVDDVKVECVGPALPEQIIKPDKRVKPPQKVTASTAITPRTGESFIVSEIKADNLKGVWAAYGKAPEENGLKMVFNSEGKISSGMAGGQDAAIVENNALKNVMCAYFQLDSSKYNLLTKPVELIFEYFDDIKGVMNIRYYVGRNISQPLLELGEIQLTGCNRWKIFRGIIPAGTPMGAFGNSNSDIQVAIYASGKFAFKSIALLSASSATPKAAASKIVASDSEIMQEIARNKRIGATGVYGQSQEENGLALLRGTGEGKISFTEIGGRDAALVEKNELKNVMCGYFLLDNWTHALLKEPSEFILEYFDGVKGEMFVRYCVGRNIAQPLLELGKVQLAGGNSWKIFRGIIPAGVTMDAFGNYNSDIQVAVYSSAGTSGKFGIKAAALLKSEK
jgi:hypothetical protein